MHTATGGEGGKWEAKEEGQEVWREAGLRRKLGGEGSGCALDGGVTEVNEKKKKVPDIHPSAKWCRLQS